MLKTALFTVGFFHGLSLVAAGGEISFTRVQLDPRFRSEGVAVADFNNDGENDVVAGDYWYEAPGWTRHEIRPPGDFWAGEGYSQSFCNWAFDINEDGYSDVIIVGFPGEPFHWYENPKGEEGHWKEHVIWHSICNETPLFTDVTGDDRPDIVFGSQPEAQMGYMEIPTGEAIYN
ncbi:MAG: VCBS repeat-containing protein, partial [Planctomycetota bacterium]